LSQTVIIDLLRARLTDLLPGPLEDVLVRQGLERAEAGDLLTGFAGLSVRRRAALLNQEAPAGAVTDRKPAEDPPPKPSPNLRIRNVTVPERWRIMFLDPTPLSPEWRAKHLPKVEPKE